MNVTNLIVYLLFLFIIYVILVVCLTYKVNKVIVTVAMLSFTVLLVIFAYYMPVNTCPETYKSSSKGLDKNPNKEASDNETQELMPSYEFTNQSGYSGSNLLEITPAKKCCLFPNSPECRNIPQEEIDAVCCSNCTKDESIEGIPSRAFKGRPVHFEYTPETNENWKWTRCEETNSNPSLKPQVL